MHLGLEWRLELDHSLFWWPRVEHGSRMISSKMRRPEVCPSAWRLWEGPLSEASEVQSTQHVMTASSALLPGGLWFSSFYASIHSDQLVRKGHVYVSTGTSSSHFTSNCKAGQNLSQCAKEAGYEVGMVAPIQWVAFQQSSRAFRQMQFSKTSYPKPRCCHTLKFRVDETAGQSHQTNRVGWDISIEIEKSDARWQTKANREKKNPYTHRRFVGMLQYSSPNPLTRMIEHQSE